MERAMAREDPDRGRSLRKTGGAVAVAFLAACVLPAMAQETVDPRSGRLPLTATDVVLRAGAGDINIQRMLDTQRTDRGPLGTRWTLSWETRLRRSGQTIFLEAPPLVIPFAQSTSASDYAAATGERLRIEANGRALKIDAEGTTDTFDRQG